VSGASSPEILAVDYDGDGRLDLVDAFLDVYRGRGDGTFEVPFLAGPVNAGKSVGAGDFNGDGWLDLAVPERSPPNIAVAPGGKGGFRALVRSKVGWAMNGIAVGDFDGDGRLDLAATEDSASPGSVDFLKGRGDGSFVFSNTAGTAVGFGPSEIIAADFDGDGRLDVAVDDNTADDLSLLLGNGDGTFQPDMPVAEGRIGHLALWRGSNTVSPIVPDSGATGHTVQITYPDGVRSARSPLTVETGPEAGAAVAADFDSDGNTDLAAAARGGAAFVVVAQGGDGRFEAPVSILGPSRKSPAMAVGDFDGDGKPDVAMAGDDGAGHLVSVFLNRSR